MWSEQKGMKLVLLNSMKESGGHAKDIKFKIRKEYFSDTHLSENGKDVWPPDFALSVAKVVQREAEVARSLLFSKII